MPSACIRHTSPAHRARIVRKTQKTHSSQKSNLFPFFLSTRWTSRRLNAGQRRTAQPRRRSTRPCRDGAPAGVPGPGGLPGSARAWAARRSDQYGGGWRLICFPSECINELLRMTSALWYKSDSAANHVPERRCSGSAASHEVDRRRVSDAATTPGGLRRGPPRPGASDAATTPQASDAATTPGDLRRGPPRLGASGVAISPTVRGPPTRRPCRVSVSCLPPRTTCTRLRDQRILLRSVLAAFPLEAPLTS